MESCACGDANFIDAPLLHRYFEEGDPRVDEVFSVIAHRIDEIQIICEAWTKLEKGTTKRPRPRNMPLIAATSREKMQEFLDNEKIAREQEYYDNLSDEAKEWIDAVGRIGVESLVRRLTSERSEKWHITVSLSLRMCVSCGASTIYSNIGEYNRYIDALLPLAQQKLTSVKLDEADKEAAKKRAIAERRDAEKRVKELERQLADAKKAHDNANERVEDGKPNLGKNGGGLRRGLF